MINSHIGHLGIFVSAKVAKLEHRAILEHVREMENMKPGLYEMKIINPTNDPDCSHDQYDVRFEERHIEDLCESISTEPLEAVRRVSERNDQLYRQMMQPWVQAFANPFTAEMLRVLHPLRVSNKMFSEQSFPPMLGIAMLAEWVRRQRSKPEESSLHQVEESAASNITSAMENFTKLRDNATKQWFELVYG